MNPAYERFVRDPRAPRLSCSFPVLLAAMAGRQAMCPTTRMHARIGRTGDAKRLLSPSHGCFSIEVAATLRRWQH